MSKKKILLLSDDIRMHSGIATMSREFVMGTIHKYDWVQVGGAVKHPEEGNIVDISESISKELKIEDAYLKMRVSNRILNSSAGIYSWLPLGLKVLKKKSNNLYFKKSQRWQRGIKFNRQFFIRKK